MRKRLSYLILATALSVAAAPAQAGTLNLGGSTETTIKYTPEDNWTGQTYLQIYASTGSSGASISLRWYEDTKPFWQSLSALTFQPYAITLTKKGSLWSGGPNFTTKLGDFNILGPNYIAGDWAGKQVRGIMFEDVPYAGMNISGYFGWPIYGKTPLNPEGTTKSFGASAEIANFRGLKLDAYGVGRVGKYLPAPIIEASDGATKQVTNVNPVYGLTDEFNLFTRQATGRPDLKWWVYYKIADDGTIMEKIAYPDVRPSHPTPETDYGFLLAAHGSSVTWADAHLQVGQKIKFIHPVTKEEISPDDVGVKQDYKELVGALEASYKLLGLDINGKFGRQIRFEGTYAPQVTNFQLVTVSSQLDVLGKDVATKPLSLTLGFRNIDQEFWPWAASTVVDSSSSSYNYIHHHRDEVGIKVTASTSILPDNPIDVTVETESFIKKSQPSNPATTTNSLSLATKLGAFSVNTSVKTSGMSFSVSRSLPVWTPLESLTPTYTLTMPTDGSVTQEVKLEGKLSLGGFKSISTTATYTATRTATGTSSATTSLLAKYTAPNGLNFEAKLTRPDDTSSRGDTYAKVSYKATF